MPPPRDAPRGRLLPTLLIACVTGALALARDARAGSFEVQGFGADGVAEVNARAARAIDGTASFYNPGGLALGRGVGLTITPTLAASALHVQGHTVALEDPFGVAVAFDATVPFEGWLSDRLRFGFGGYFLPATAMRLITRAGDAPFFPYYDNRTQRIVVIPALALRVARGVGVGVGANVLAGVEGPADVTNGASGAPEPRIDEAVTTVLRLHAGVRFDPREDVRLAVTYRQRFSVPSLVATSAEIGGVPLDVDIDVAEALFDPDTIVVATSFDVGATSLELDVSYAVWSAYAGPFVDVHAVLPGVDVSSKLPGDLFRDVVSVRAAGEHRVAIGPGVGLTVRGGAGFEPSVLRDARQGRSNLVDGDRAMFGLGASVSLGDVVPGTLTIGAGASAQIVAPFEQDKRACPRSPCAAGTVAGPDAASPSSGITNPGYPTLTAGGALWSMALGVGIAR